MLRNVFLKTLRDRRRSLIGWSIGMAAFAATSVAFWPSIRETAPDLNRLFQSLPAALRGFVGGESINLASPEGYLEGRVFALIAPLLLLVFAIGFGARTVAGEEQRGTLELVLATPVPRWRVVADKLAAMSVATVILGVVLWATLATTGELVDLGVGAGPLASAVTMAVLLAVAFGALALAIGCATGRRGVASAVSSSVAVTAYVVKAYAPLVEWLERFRAISPFYYYDAADPLRGGIDPLHAGFFIFLVFVFASVSLISFDRRDVGV